jgi:hypothetical protein
VESWKIDVRKSLGAVTLIVSVAEKCFEITDDAFKRGSGLYARHATGTHRCVIVISEYTDVFVMFLAFSTQTGYLRHLLLRRGKNKV